MLQCQRIKLPPPKPLSDKRPHKVPHFLLGDEGFGLCQFLLRPFAGKYLAVSKKIFNYRLTRARRYIECSFGILTNKWRILHRALNVEESLARNIIKTCCLLHNFVRDRDGYRFEDIFSVHGLVDDMGVDNSQSDRGRGIWNLVRGGLRGEAEASSTRSPSSPPTPGLEHRIDYILREGNLGATYISALTSHTAYWSNYDTAFFILTHLIPELKAENSPQETLTETIGDNSL
ncbi:hypothetical protein J437_LFUL014354 [Ladona fulva]|uniref:DDHD domain-containing protein n=1 Tax=Ladona fulva TaxID=123851 RepID=A0A8K0PEI2_LADFU|nr:hypothetical protein J437_LFUL014354 [Ladona fulva]